MVWRLPIRGCISKRGLLTGNKLGFHISVPCTHESDALDVIMTKNARNSRKVQKRQGHFVSWCAVFLQCSEIESDCFEIFQSQLGNPRIPPFEFLSHIACRSKKQDAGMLTGNARRIFCDNVTCFGTNKSCSNRRHLSEFFIKALRFLLAWSPCFFTQNPRFLFSSGRRYWQHGRNNSHFGLKNVPFLFGMASSLLQVVD